jgi:hypothetical protein
VFESTTADKYSGVQGCEIRFLPKGLVGQEILLVFCGTRIPSRSLVQSGVIMPQILSRLFSRLRIIVALQSRPIKLFKPFKD